MTNDERIEISNKCAELYGVKPYTGLMPIDEGANQLPHLKTDGWLIDDWSRLMPLVVEYEVYIRFGFDYVLTKVYQVEFTEFFNGHPTEAHAVQAAIVKALIAKKESEK